MRPLFASLLLAAATLSPAAVQARDVDVSLSLGFAHPGFVGRVDVGRPYAYPVYLAPQPVYMAPQPVYVLPAPRYHRHHHRHHHRHAHKAWRQQCERYGDCGYYRTARRHDRHDD